MLPQVALFFFLAFSLKHFLCTLTWPTSAHTSGYRCLSFCVCIPLIPQSQTNVSNLNNIDYSAAMWAVPIFFFYLCSLSVERQCWIVYDGDVDWVKKNGCVQCKTRNPQVLLVYNPVCLNFHLQSSWAFEVLNDASDFLIPASKIYASTLSLMLWFCDFTHHVLLVPSLFWWP